MSTDLASVISNPEDEPSSPTLQSDEDTKSQTSEISTEDSLKKKQPSYTDTFNLISFENELDENNGILVKVGRLSDKKKFLLPLADLKSTGEESKNYQLLDDYSVWFVNN